MRKLILTLFLGLFAGHLFAQGAPSRGGADQPYTMEYYYKVQWGHQKEFFDLFLKNHYPLLLKHVESGNHIELLIAERNSVRQHPRLGSHDAALVGQRAGFGIQLHREEAAKLGQHGQVAAGAAAHFQDCGICRQL